MLYFEWLLAAVNIMHDYTRYCLCRIYHPDDEHQVCSKQVEDYCWNKLIENSTSYWFMVYRYVKNHGQQSVKNNMLCTGWSKFKFKMFSCYKESANRVWSLSVLRQFHCYMSCNLNTRNLNSNNSCNFNKQQSHWQCVLIYILLTG